MWYLLPLLIFAGVIAWLAVRPAARASQLRDIPPPRVPPPLASRTSPVYSARSIADEWRRLLDESAVQLPELERRLAAAMSSGVVVLGAASQCLPPCGQVLRASGGATFPDFSSPTPGAWRASAADALWLAQQLEALAPLRTPADGARAMLALRVAHTLTDGVAHGEILGAAHGALIGAEGRTSQDWLDHCRLIAATAQRRTG